VGRLKEIDGKVAPGINKKVSSNMKIGGHGSTQLSHDRNINLETAVRVP
jgi:hypothetical protein